MKVTVRAQDRDGNWFEKTGEPCAPGPFAMKLTTFTVFCSPLTSAWMLTPEELENGFIEEEE